MLTVVNKRKLSLRRLVSLLSTNPAKVFGLSSKGRLKKGMDGDLILVDMKKRGKIRSEEHTSELQSRPHLVCRLLLEKKKNSSSSLDNRVGSQCRSGA